MTHVPETVHEVLKLREAGLGARRISAATGVPISTVRDWISGKKPTTRSGPCDGSCLHGEEHAQVYPYLLGLYLGDGCLSPHPRGVFKLRIFLDARYPEILGECEAAISAVRPAASVGRLAKKGCFEIYAYSKHWPCLFPQHGPGRKHERRIALRGWQWREVERDPRLFLRGLIHSDGCRFTNTGRADWTHPRYSFRNKSDDILDIFCDTLGLLDLRWPEARDTIYVSRKDDVARLDEFVGPKA